MLWFQSRRLAATKSGPLHFILFQVDASTARTYPASSAQLPPEMDPEGVVYILDFSYNLETTTKLWQFHGGRVTLLNHHKSAMEELQGQLPGCYFDMNRSTAAIAWGYFKPLERIPDLLAYVQDRDLLRWELPDSRAVNAAIEAAPMDFEVWSKLEIEGLRTQGEIVVDLNNRRIEELLKSSCLGADRRLHRAGGGGGQARVGDRRAALGTPSSSAVRRGVPPRRRPRRIEVTRYSLHSGGRSDVADIAREQGSGGHAAAAGFSIQRA